MLNYESIEFKSPDEFDAYLKSALLATDYERLNDTLGLNSIWWSRLRSNPQDMKLDVVLKLATALKTTPYALLETYGVGAKGMTAGECLSLQAMHLQTEKATA